MKVKQLFQSLASAVITVALVFGFAIAPASAAVYFSAPLGFNTTDTYNGDLELGVTYYDVNGPGYTLWCDSQYGRNPDVGLQWQHTCESKKTQQEASTKYSVQGFYKVSSPDGNNCWNKAQVLSVTEIPPLTPGANQYLISWLGADASSTIQTTIEGINLEKTGIGSPYPDQIPDTGLCPF